MTPHFSETGLRVRRVVEAAATADDHPMQVIPFHHAPPLEQPFVRCECARCGSHVHVRASWQLSGQCRNCGSYDLRELAGRDAPTPPLPAIAALRRVA